MAEIKKAANKSATKRTSSRKKVKIIRIEALLDHNDAVKIRQVLEKMGVPGMTIYRVLGEGNAPAREVTVQGKKIKTKLLQRDKIEVICPSDKAKKYVAAIEKGTARPCKIFISEIKEVIDVR